MQGGPRPALEHQRSPHHQNEHDAGRRSCSRGDGTAANNRGETDMRSKYPNVRVALVGEDENAFAIVERVQRALREAGVPTAEVSKRSR
jgi:hypothetical protein